MNETNVRESPVTRGEGCIQGLGHVRRKKIDSERQRQEDAFCVNIIFRGPVIRTKKH